MVESSSSPAGEAPRATGSREVGAPPTKGQLDAVTQLLGGEEPRKELEDDPKPTGGNDEDLAAALAEGDADKSGDEGGKPGEGPLKGKPKTLDALAEGLGVKVEDLYDLKISMGNDLEPMTLGALKDNAKDTGSLEVQRLAFEESKAKKETDFLRAQGELNEIVSMLPREAIKPELVNAIKDKHAKLAQRERSLTLQAIDEWSDEDKETSDRTAMGEYLSQYGFPTHYLQNVLDHRMLKFIRDSMQRKQRIDRALAKVQEIPDTTPAPTGKPSKSRGTNRQQSNRTLRTDTQNVAAIADLLNG